MASQDGTGTDADGARGKRERGAIRSDAAAEERDELLSVAAHEIRTPLASLRLYLDAMIKAADRGTLTPADAAVRLRKAQRQCDRLNILLSNLLDVSRAPTRQLSVILEPIDLGATVVAICERLRDPFVQQGRRLDVAVPQEPLWGDFDRMRLEQIVTNLVTNAHKHAPGASVRVAVDPAPGDRVALVVSDDGPGIRAEERQRIFERSGQAKSTGRSMGLGLWIVAQVVEAFGGTIRCTSELGHGATFTIDLPRRSTGADSKTSPEAADGDGQGRSGKA